MKKIMTVLILMLFFTLSVKADTGKTKDLTVMIYMCGSNLESEGGAASTDIAEILKSEFNTDEVNVVLMAGGSSQWTSGIVPADKTTAIVEFVKPRKRYALINVWPNAAKGEEAAAMNMGSPDTLTFFLNYGAEHYPASEYALILWNHGAGPMNGLCWDEIYNADHLTLDELTAALGNSYFSGEKLSWIGFDACLMSSVEVASRMAPYASYMIASQAEEPKTGWNYAFLKGIENDENGAATGERIVNEYFEFPQKTDADLTMACIDLSVIGLVEENMSKMFRSLTGRLDTKSFSEFSKLRLSATGFGKQVGSSAAGSGYDLVDILSLSESYLTENPQQAEELSESIKQAVVCNRSNVPGANGLSAYHPYRNQNEFRSEWQGTYQQMGFCPEYTAFIDAYGRIMTGEQLVRWNNLTAIRTAENGIVTLELSDEQIENLASARLVVFSRNLYDIMDDSYFRLFSTADVSQSGNLLSSVYDNSALSVINAGGYGTMTGAVSYRVTEDGIYQVDLYPFRSDDPGQYDGGIARLNEHPVIAEYIRDGSGQMILKDFAVFDEMTGTYSRRTDIDWSQYDGITFLNEYKNPTKNEADEYLAFDAWENDVHADALWKNRQDIDRTDFSLSFLTEYSHGEDLYAAFEITDTQGNVYTSELKHLSESQVSYFDTDISLGDHIPDSDLLYAGFFENPDDRNLLFFIEVFNMTDEEQMYTMTDITLNGVPLENLAGFLLDGEGENVKFGHNCLSPYTWGTVVLFLKPEDLGAFGPGDRLYEISGRLLITPGEEESRYEHDSIGFSVSVDYPLSVLIDDPEERGHGTNEVYDIPVNAPALGKEHMSVGGNAILRPAQDSGNVRLLINFAVDNTADHDLIYSASDITLNDIPINALGFMSFRGTGEVGLGTRNGIAPGETGNLVLDLRYEDLKNIIPDVTLSKIGFKLIISVVENGESHARYFFPVIINTEIPLNAIYDETETLPSQFLVDYGKENNALDSESAKLLFSHRDCSVFLQGFYVVGNKAVLLLRAENESELDWRIFLGNAEMNGLPAKIGKRINSSVEVHNRHTQVYGLNRMNWQERTGAVWEMAAGESKEFYVEVSSEDPSLDSLYSLGIQPFIYEVNNVMNGALYDRFVIRTEEAAPLSEGFEAIAPAEDYQVTRAELYTAGEETEILNTEVTVSDGSAIREIPLYTDFPEGQTVQDGYYALLRHVRSDKELASMNIINDVNIQTGKTVISFANGREWLLYEMIGDLNIAADGRSASAQFPGLMAAVKEDEEFIPLNIVYVHTDPDGVWHFGQTGNGLYFYSTVFPDAVLPYGVGSIDIDYDRETGQAMVTDYKQTNKAFNALAGIVTQSVYPLLSYSDTGQILSFLNNDDVMRQNKLKQELLLNDASLKIALLPVDPDDYDVVFFYRTDDGEIHASAPQPLAGFVPGN